MTKPSVTKPMTIRRGSTKPEATKPGVESEILQESQAQQKAAATVSSREESRVLQELQARYPEVRWVAGKRFSFRPPRTIPRFSDGHWSPAAGTGGLGASAHGLAGTASKRAGN